MRIALDTAAPDQPVPFTLTPKAHAALALAEPAAALDGDGTAQNAGSPR